MYQKTIDSVGQKVLELYNSGVNCLQISEAVGSSKKTVKEVLLHYGIDYTAEYNKKQEEKKQQVIDMYYRAVTQIDIEKNLHITRKDVRKILDSHLGRRTKSQAQLLRRENTLNENAFDDLTDPETAYWIGFIYADGHVTDKLHRIDIGLIHTDVQHLRKLKTFLNTTTDIKIKKNGKNNKCQLTIHSEVIANRFKELGFDNQKSFTAHPPADLLYSRDFWRGVVDGDGCLHLIKSLDICMIHLCGTYSTIEGFIEFVKRYIQSINKIPRNAKGKDHFQVAFYKEAFLLTEILYKDSVVYLDRKYKIYQEWINNTIL